MFTASEIAKMYSIAINGVPENQYAYFHLLWGAFVTSDLKLTGPNLLGEIEKTFNLVLV